MEPVSHRFMINMGWIHNSAGEYYYFNWNEETQFQVPQEMVWESTMEDLRTCMYQMLAKHCYRTGYEDGLMDEQNKSWASKYIEEPDKVPEYGKEKREDPPMPEIFADFINEKGWWNND